MAYQPKVVAWEHQYVLSLPVSTVALEQGDLLSFESNVVVLMDAATEDATFVGVSGGKTDGSNAGDYIDIYTKCLVDIQLASATYALGAGLKYSAKNTLVADGDANTIAHIWDFNTATRTRGKVLIDIPALGIPADKLFHTISA